MITEIKFECGGCGQRILVDGTAAGMSADCPNCHATVMVPKAGGDSAAKRPREGHRRASVGTPMRAKSELADTGFSDPEMGALRQELVDASTQITRAEDELADLHAQLAAARADAEKHHASALSAQAEIKSERIALRNEAAQLKQKLELTRAEVEKARAETNGLTGELGLSQRETETVRQQLHDREIEFAEVCTGLAESQAERTSALREIQALSETRKKLEAELSTARASLAAATQAAAQLDAATQELASERALHATANERGKALGAEVEALKAEAVSLRRSISESSTGRELIETRDRLAAVEIERDRFAGEVRQLREDARKQDAAAADLLAQVKTVRRQLEVAQRVAEAQSEEKLRQDNEVLRGIVERQNAELAQKHAQIVKFKRARLALRMVYATFALALIALGVIAVKYVPALRF